MRIDVTTDIDIGPKEVAEAFWSMDNNQQAEFFHYLYEAIQRDNEQEKTWFPGDSFASIQWYQLRDGMKRLPEKDRLNAANMVRAVAVEFFKYTLGDAWDWERMDYEVGR